MALSSSPGLKAYQNRGLSSPRRTSYSPLLSSSALGLSETYFDQHRRGSLEARFGRRGLSLEEVEEYGLIDPQEHSKLFEGMPISEEEIKKLPKKLRGYYTYMAQIYEHYVEVESLLSGEMPGRIAKSFEASKSGRGRSDNVFEESTPSRRERSASPGLMMRDGSRSYRNGHSDGGNGKGKDKARDNDGEDEEAGEDTGLLDPLSKREAKRERIARIALNVNTLVNVLLVATKAVAVLYSSSISLTASLVDSALDLLSTFIILGTSWAIGIQTDQHLYPAGKRRFEPLGVLIFSVAMIASFVQVFIESFERAIGRTGEPAVELSWLGLGTMLGTIGVKAILWVWCSQIPSSGVQALAQDAENDVWLNVMSLSFPWLGTRLGWRLLDPIGGMVLSTYIMVEWVKTLLLNFANLSGRSASRDQVTRVLYLVTRFNPVLEIGDVECYHIGDEFIVEVDVILPQSSTLHFAHDVGETIQCVLEGLDGVLRAYVHCDYSSRNPPQHTSRLPGTTPSKIPSKLSQGYGANGQSTGDRSNSQSSSDSATPRPRYLDPNTGSIAPLPSATSKSNNSGVIHLEDE